MGTWWQRFLVWLGISEPGTRKEQVEDWITAHESDIVALRNRLASQRGTFSKLAGETWYIRIDKAEKIFGTTIPTWADVGVDVFEAPTSHLPKHTRMGYALNIYVTEFDTSQWVIRIDSVAGSLGWTEIKSVRSTQLDRR